MLAAALTAWTMFALWLLAPHAQLPARIARLAGTFCAVELVALLAWSYGVEACEERACAPLAQAAGIAARTDIPALAALFLVFACIQLRRAQPPP